MKPGDVVLITLPQAAGAPPKPRPALILASLPGPYQNLLLCGISTQRHQLQKDWDELLEAGDPDYGNSGVHQPSVIRLSFLYAADGTEISGVIGRVDAARLARLCERLADHLSP